MAPRAPMARVSVIMNCYNGSKHLREAIDSVFSQTCDDWEIICWDDASTDATGEIAQSYGGKLLYFRGEKASSLGQARNRALEKAAGEFIAFLDQDDIWLPEKLEKQILIMSGEPEVTLVYTNYWKLQPGGRKRTGLKGTQPSGDVFERFLFHYPVALSTALVRRNAAQALDAFFDEALNLSEEFDLFMRMLYQSEAAYLEEPLAVYRIHAGMSSVKLMDRYPVENRHVIDKFKRMHPDFESRYAEALAHLEARIGYWQARADMSRGRRLDARVALRPHRWASALYFMLYAATFFPAGFWHLAHRLTGKGYITSGEGSH